MSGPVSTLADSCCRRQWIELCRCLAQGCPVNQSDERGVTPLQICAASGWAQAVILLLKHKADVHLVCPLGWTALMQGVRNGHTEVVKILIDAGANISDRNLLGWDAVCLAVESQNKELLSLLVSMVKSSELTPALAIACQLGRVDFVRYLLNQQADVNGKLPVSGLTPLMLAACSGHSSVVEVLLSHGANPHIINSSNLTALDMALMNGQGGIGATLSLHPKNALNMGSTLLLSPYAPLTKASPYDTMPMTCRGGSRLPCTPVFHTTSMRTNSPKIFKFPPSPTCVCASPIFTHCIPSPASPHHSALHSPYHSPSSAPAWLMPHNLYHCISPSPCSSPMIPPWMFTNGLRHQKMKPKFTAKSPKSLQSWWKKMKIKCRRKKPTKQIKVNVTCAEEYAAQTDKQFEALLSSLNLDFLLPLLKSHEIDLETFLHLRKADLEEMGIVDKALQFSILQKISCTNSSMVC